MRTAFFANFFLFLFFFILNSFNALENNESGDVESFSLTQYFTADELKNLNQQLEKKYRDDIKTKIENLSKAFGIKILNNIIIIDDLWKCFVNEQRKHGSTESLEELKILFLQLFSAHGNKEEKNIKMNFLPQTDNELIDFVAKQHVERQRKFYNEKSAEREYQKAEIALQIAKDLEYKEKAKEQSTLTQRIDKLRLTVSELLKKKNLLSDSKENLQKEMKELFPLPSILKLYMNQSFFYGQRFLIALLMPILTTKYVLLPIMKQFRALIINIFLNTQRYFIGAANCDVIDEELYDLYKKKASLKKYLNENDNISLEQLKTIYQAVEKINALIDQLLENKTENNSYEIFELGLRHEMKNNSLVRLTSIGLLFATMTYAFYKLREYEQLNIKEYLEIAQKWLFEKYDNDDLKKYKAYQAIQKNIDKVNLDLCGIKIKYEEHNTEYQKLIEDLMRIDSFEKLKIEQDKLPVSIKAKEQFLKQSTLSSEEYLKILSEEYIKQNILTGAK